MAKKCNFCGNDIEPGTGTMYVRKDGKIYYFCSSKCRKNLLKLKRDPKKVRWTKFYIKRT
ncbi:MAG TPA: TRASH domain-containing protein [Thermoplasmatales archaeon]|nr:TRASH domain-containing protein [Thermoplasmatales archaeon]